MKKDIEKGDLLKSNPLNGYWVCSIALSNKPKSSEFNAMSHVGITNAVFDHDFDFKDIDPSKLKIIHTMDDEDNMVSCIAIYASKLVKDITVIGKLDADSYFKYPLEFKIGNGSDGGWPQSGPLKKSLGYQAVHQWRAVNDREAWLNDIAEAERSHEAMLARIKNG
jgi:nitrogen regulatory protein PII-like uncharacterized protein